MCPRRRHVFSCALFAFFHIASASANNRSNLESEGWSAVGRSTVEDTFNGCDFDLPVPLEGGFVFLCGEYKYHYAYRPEFVVMEKSGARKYLIDDDEYEGLLVQGSVISTQVEGAFNGCDFGRVIPLLNGMLFQCQTYKYHYAYQPRVTIFRSYVTIDGDKYEGIIYQR